MSRRGLVTYSQRVSEPRNINYEENVGSGRGSHGARARAPRSLELQIALCIGNAGGHHLAPGPSQLYCWTVTGNK